MSESNPYTEALCALRDNLLKPMHSSIVEQNIESTRVATDKILGDLAERGQSIAGKLVALETRLTELAQRQESERQAMADAVARLEKALAEQQATLAQQESERRADRQSLAASIKNLNWEA